MTRLSTGLLAVVLAALSSSSSTLMARQRTQTNRPNDPGMPTVARMYILNAGAEEAIPVTLHSGRDVQPVSVMSLPPVISNAGRQVWEYRQVSVSSGQDPASVLNVAGGDGWEAVSASTSNNLLQVLMKRPR